MDGAGAPEARKALGRFRCSWRLDERHDWLVVSGLGLAGAAGAVLAVPEPAAAEPVAALEPEALAPELIELRAPPEDADLVAAVRAEPGREMSCPKITPQVAANIETASTVTRLRITMVRRRRISSRSATSLLLSAAVRPRREIGW